MRIFTLLPAAFLFCAGATSPLLAQDKVRASDVVVNGESFFAASNITSELTRLARADGYIGANESFRQVAVSGAVISGIINQYKNCNPKPVFLISDGGGNDLMQSCGGNPTPNCAVIKNTVDKVKQYFEQMKADGTKKVLWMRYPDPLGDRWATLKANQDVFNPEVETICKASTEPECLWVDLRTTWQGHPEYTSDGIHATNAGGTATAQAFWKAIKDNDFFNLDAPTRAAAPEKTARSAFLGQVVANRTLSLSLDLDRPAPVALKIATLAGRTVLAAESRVLGAGKRTVEFPLGSVQPGVYRIQVRAGQDVRQSALLLP
jgi:hypothetical protein